MCYITNNVILVSSLISKLLATKVDMTSVVEWSAGSMSKTPFQYCFGPGCLEHRRCFVIRQVLLGPSNVCDVV